MAVMTKRRRRDGKDGEAAPVMTPASFKRWRKSLKLSQKEAAEALGLKRRMVQYYETGVRDEQQVVIPKTVRLACQAVLNGCKDYGGPDAGG